MKINEKGELTINIQEICDSLSPEDRRAFLKQNCIHTDVIKWVTDWILDEDEDGWYGSSYLLREDLLRRAEEKQIKNTNRYNWTLIRNAEDILRNLISEQHLYSRLYHHPNRYKTTISEFIAENNADNQFQHKSEKLENKIREVIDIIKGAVDNSI